MLSLSCLVPLYCLHVGPGTGPGRRRSTEVHNPTDKNHPQESASVSCCPKRCPQHLIRTLSQVLIPLTWYYLPLPALPPPAPPPYCCPPLAASLLRYRCPRPPPSPPPHPSSTIRIAILCSIFAGEVEAVALLPMPFSRRLGRRTHAEVQSGLRGHITVLSRTAPRDDLPHRAEHPGLLLGLLLARRTGDSVSELSDCCGQDEHPQHPKPFSP